MYFVWFCFPGDTLLFLDYYYIIWICLTPRQHDFKFILRPQRKFKSFLSLQTVCTDNTPNEGLTFR